MNSQRILEDYLEGMLFEERTIDEMTPKMVRNLKPKEGFVFITRTTPLWVYRELSLDKVMNMHVVMEAENQFVVMDGFGVIIWTGDAPNVLEYVKGFMDSPEKEKTLLT